MVIVRAMAILQIFAASTTMFRCIFGDIWFFALFGAWNMVKTDAFGCFQRSLKSKKISGRFHFWTFGFLEVAVILTFCFVEL